jgi:serine/threonine protein kinase
MEALDHIGKYEIGRKLGQGGFGEIYAGRDTELGRELAIKVLRPEHTQRPQVVQRFLQEARAAARISHPGIVTVFECGQTDDHTVYIAMELLVGETLAARIKRELLPLPTVIALTRQLASALAAAHASGIIHRDLKPQNVFLVPDAAAVGGVRVKILDFGIAKLSDTLGSNIQTHSMEMMGTPLYMSPEQCKSSANVDGRSDIYALGCMFYAMLTGSPPFAGKTFVEVLQAKELGTFPTARSVNENVPERLDLVLLKMVQKQPKHRYATGAEVVRDLESLGLAATRLSFLAKMPKSGLVADAKPGPGKTLTESGVPSIDPHVWYLKMSGGIGKFSTEQVLAMIDSGKVNMTTMASHLVKSDYRALTTYKDFTAPLAKAARSADRTSSRYEDIYREAEQRDKVREETLATHRDRGEWRDVALYYAGYAAAGVAGLLFFYWFMSRFWS